jgi:hypothetical protein
LLRSERTIVMIFGDPEGRRLGFAMAIEREAVIGVEHYEAEPDEPAKAFHARMCGAARDRGEMIVLVGSDEPMREPLPYPAPTATSTLH